MAVDGLPVTVTCPGLCFSKQAFCQWKRNAVTQRDREDAHLTKAAWDAHHDDPTFGYRFIAEHPASIQDFMSTPQSSLRVDDERLTPPAWLIQGGDPPAIVKILNSFLQS
jgi:hypothetical protein